MCDENTYVVSRCRRGDWYILLRNVGKIPALLTMTVGLLAETN